MMEDNKQKFLFFLFFKICGTILWRLNNKSAKVRQQAADLISRIGVVMKTCQEEKLMGHLGVSFVLFIIRL